MWEGFTFGRTGHVGVALVYVSCQSSVDQVD